MTAKISIICIGDELLKGKITNTHLTYIGKNLFNYGIIPEIQLTVKDNPTDIVNAINTCKDHSDFVILTGGLGPTTDDLTVKTIADYFDLPLIQSRKALTELKQFMKFRGYKTISETNLKQTFIPETAEAISNPNGTAPGIKLNINNITLFMLPGPPHELKPMFEKYVLPEILTNINHTSYFESVYAINIPESGFQEQVSKILGSAYSNFNIAFRAIPGMCELMISGIEKQQVRSAIDKIKSYYKNSILTNNFSHPAEELADYFTKYGITLSTAESCTGGMIASKITDIPGASAFFKGSAIVYSNELKEKLLSVSHETLINHGAVSEETAKEMVEGVCKNLGTNAGIATTGIAGPGGGTPEKPVGLIYIAVKLFDKFSIKKYKMRGSREVIRQRSVIAALDELRKLTISDTLNKTNDIYEN